MFSRWTVDKGFVDLAITVVIQPIAALCRAFVARHVAIIAVRAFTAFTEAVPVAIPVDTIEAHARYGPALPFVIAGITPAAEPVRAVCPAKPPIVDRQALIPRRGAGGAVEVLHTGPAKVVGAGSTPPSRVSATVGDKPAGKARWAAGTIGVTRPHTNPPPIRIGLTAVG